MKQVKMAYEKCKTKLPKRPPDEIDFGLGYQTALEWILSWETDSESIEIIKRELDDETKKT